MIAFLSSTTPPIAWENSTLLFSFKRISWQNLTLHLHIFFIITNASQNDLEWLPCLSINHDCIPLFNPLSKFDGTLLFHLLPMVKFILSLPICLYIFLIFTNATHGDSDDFCQSVMIAFLFFPRGNVTVLLSFPVCNSTSPYPSIFTYFSSSSKME